MLAMDKSLFTSHLCFHFSHSAQLEDTPLGLLAFTKIPALLYGLKRSSTKVPIQNAYLSVYMPLSLQLILPSFHHQSSTSTPYRIYY